MRPWLFVLAMCMSVGRASAQTTAPATAPSTAPVAVEMLDDGRVRITPPAGWVLAGRGEDGLTLRYTVNGGEGIMTVIVAPQNGSLSRESVTKMAKVVARQLRDVAKRDGAEFLIPPRVEPDDRFLLKVRDRTRGPDGKARDQLQIYRQMGLDLVHVAIVATVEGEDTSRPIFAAGETLLDTAKLGIGPKPSAFRKTRVRLTIPIDWVEQRTDDPNGVVATYTNDAFSGARLVVRSRIIPKAAKGRPDMEQGVIDALIDALRHAPLPEGSLASEREETNDQAGFTRFVTRTVAINGEAWRQDFRCLVVGDVAVGVESLAAPRDAGAVAMAADEMARSLKPLADRPPVADSKPPAPRPARGPRRREEVPPMGLPPPEGRGIRGNPGGR